MASGDEPGPSCRSCGAALARGDVACPICRTPTSEGTAWVRDGAGPAPRTDAWAGPGLPPASPDFGRVEPERAGLRDQRRANTGLVLLLVGVLLAWIPYVDLLGAALILVGVLFVYAGRRGFGPAHERSARRGAELFFVALIVGALAVAVFVGVAFDDAFSSGATLAHVVSAIDLDLLVFVPVIVGLATVLRLGMVYLVSEIAGPRGRRWLWAGFAVGLVLSVATAAVVLTHLPTVTSSGATVTTDDGSKATVSLPGTVNDSLQTYLIWLSLAGFLPNLLYAEGYVLTRRHAISPEASPGVDG